MGATRRQTAALGALALILVITAAWWALALWPGGATAAGPAWIERTRLACFGAEPGGLPNAGGWMVMTGQPLAMLLVLFAAWGRDVRDGLRALQSGMAGQVTTGVVAAALLAGATGVVLRVSNAGARPFESSTTERLAAQLTWVDDSVPTMRLVDQAGQVVDLARFQGKPVLVSFAYAHCETVCPLTVMDLLEVQTRLRRELVATASGAVATVIEAMVPEVVVVTLDPLRDTPSRLPTIAAQWKLGAGAHVLSGPVEDVERTLNAWRVPRVRNAKTGDLTHPTMVYVIGRDGRIHYVVPSGAELIAAAVKGV